MKKRSYIEKIIIDKGTRGYEVVTKTHEERESIVGKFIVFFTVVFAIALGVLSAVGVADYFWKFLP